MTGRQENYSSENWDKTKASNAWGILKSLMLIKKLACLLFMVLVGCAGPRAFTFLADKLLTAHNSRPDTLNCNKADKNKQCPSLIYWQCIKMLFCAIYSPKILSPCCSQEKRFCYWLEMASIVSATLFRPPTAMFHKNRLAVGGRGQDRGIQNADFDFVCFVECKQSSGRYLLKNWR